jgi:hypothetical protein
MPTTDTPRQSSAQVVDLAIARAAKSDTPKTSNTTSFRTEEEWAVIIRPDLEQETAAHISAGRKLIEAKSDLKARNGSFLRLLDLLGYNEDKAERSMAIARHPVLSDSATLRNLPTSGTTLYQLSRIKPELLSELVANGTVHSRLTHEAAKGLRKTLRDRCDDGDGTRHDDNGDHDNRDNDNAVGRQPRNRVRAQNHREAKLGADLLVRLRGTSLGTAREQDALIFLNRGAPDGVIIPVVRHLIEDAVTGKNVSAVATAAKGFGHIESITAKGAGEDEDRFRRLEIENAGLRSEIEKLKAERDAAKTELAAAKATPSLLSSWTAATPEERAGLFKSVSRAGVMAAIPRDWDLEARMLRQVTPVKLMGEVDRRLSLELQKQFRTAVTGITQALASTAVSARIIH